MKEKIKKLETRNSAKLLERIKKIERNENLRE